MRINLALLTCCVFALFSRCSCEKDVEDAIQIQGFLLVDPVGNHVGESGSAADDWKVTTSLSPTEMQLFDFDTPHNLVNTIEANITLPLTPFPNPFATTQRYVTNVADSVVLKVVVVDARLNILKTYGAKIKGSHVLELDYSDRSKFRDRAALRVYYSYSALDRPSYRVGYGDIKICDQGAGSVQDCFK